MKTEIFLLVLAGAIIASMLNIWIQHKRQNLKAFRVKNSDHESRFIDLQMESRFSPMVDAVAATLDENSCPKGVSPKPLIAKSSEEE